MIPTLTAALITLAASPVATPPADPCDPPTVVTNCYQAQLPAETNGRQIDTPNGVGVMIDGKVIVPSPTPAPTATRPVPTHPHRSKHSRPSARPLPKAAIAVFENTIRAFMGEDAYHWRVKPE